jgi:hypothetical protein
MIKLNLPPKLMMVFWVLPPLNANVFFVGFLNIFTLCMTNSRFWLCGFLILHIILLYNHSFSFFCFTLSFVIFYFVSSLMQLLLFSFVLKTCFTHPYFSNDFALGLCPRQKNDLVSDAPKARITHLFRSITF